jgi:hypothetical protein
MVDKCANPACSAQFRRLGNGRLFAFEKRAVAGYDRAPSAAENGAGSTSLLFWLCDTCRLTNALVVDAGGNIFLRRLEGPVESAVIDDATFNDESQLWAR